MKTLTVDTSQTILAQLDAWLDNHQPSPDFAKQTVALIGDRLPHYNWVGIYWLCGDTLALGPYVGKPTDHTRIPVGVGVCGTAVTTGENQIVDDVRQLENYLACTLETRAEIVVLIRHPENARILGQLDIDSDSPKAFGLADEAFLEAVGQRIARWWLSASPQARLACAAPGEAG